jgi:hypothetical protein
VTTDDALYSIPVRMLPGPSACYTGLVAGGSDAEARERCSHPEVADGRCVLCGSCTHEVILNGACYFCGETDLSVTVRPAEGPRSPAVVPADRLRRKP